MNAKDKVNQDLLENGGSEAKSLDLLCESNDCSQTIQHTEANPFPDKDF